MVTATGARRNAPGEASSVCPVDYSRTRDLGDGHTEDLLANDLWCQTRPSLPPVSVRWLHVPTLWSTGNALRLPRSSGTLSVTAEPSRLSCPRTRRGLDPGLASEFQAQVTQTP